MLITDIVPALGAGLVILSASAAGPSVCRAASDAAPPPAVKADVEQPARDAPRAASFKVVTELDNCVFSILQDSKGAYWFSNGFGAGSGLYRWSGVGNTFDHFTTESGLGDNAVSGVQEDRAGNLYFSTATGISKFDGRTFTTLKLDETEPPRTEVKLTPDLLWFRAGGDEPHALYYDGTSLRRLKIPRTPGGEMFETLLPRSKYPRRGCAYDAYTIYKDSRGNVWFGTAALGACRFDGKNFTWIGEKELGFDERNYQSFGTRSIIEDREGMFWITVTRHRFNMYPTPAETTTSNAGGLMYIESAGLPHAAVGADEDYTYIMSMARDNAGDLWMATLGAGVWRYDGKTLTNYPVIVDGAQISVFSIYCDRVGGLWLGTHEHGVFKFNGTAFEGFRP